MSLTAGQIATLKTELGADPYSLGYSPYVQTTDLDSLIALLSFVRDGVTACPTNGVVGKTGNVTGATNANPIVVTSVAHGLKTGDSVVIAGVGGNTAANGTWTITKLTADTFSVPVAGNGSFTSGGTWTWCVTGVRQQSVGVQDIIGAIAPADLITNGVATQPTADQFGKLILFQALCNDGQVALTNADGSDNNNAKTLKQVVSNPSASRTAIIALEVRTGSRIENLLGLSGVTLSEGDIHAALS
jgi:hypothetical protein